MRNTVFRPTALAVALWLPSIAMAQQCESSSHTITFSEFAEGTAISGQYADKGVGFSSGSFIASDSSNPTSPVLSGTPRFTGSITAAFVDPSNATVRVAATSASFQAGYFDDIGSTEVTYLDIDNRVIRTERNQSRGIETFTAPEGTHAISIGGTSDSAGFAIDNLRFALASSPLNIAAPTEGAKFAQMVNNHTRSGDITLQAGGSAAVGDITWTLVQEYDTDRPRNLPGLTSTLTSSGTGTAKVYYQSRGGRITIKSRDAQGREACPTRLIYVVGDTLTEDEITNRLTTLYRTGATPRLLTGIADKESTYRQFELRTKYDQSALWPVESREDGGSHIGLMQVASAGAQGVKNAWDWLENTEQAMLLFREKLALGRNLENRIRNTRPGLRELTAVERENMALALYGPYAGATFSEQYYRAVQRSDGSYDWVVNTENNPGGVGYANDVRSRIR